MGAAEFEFGTLPHTFNIMRELAVAGKLSLWKTPNLVTYQNKPFWVLAPSAWSITEMEDKLRELIEGKVYCKESPYLEYWMPTVKKIEFRFERDAKCGTKYTANLEFYTVLFQG